MKILAVVVTHNRCELLARCVDQIRMQTRSPDMVLVINNASNDGTTTMLESKGVTYLTQTNVGSAGGWYKGIEVAVAESFDAVWLMDDDGFPDKSSLHELESRLVDGVACASSVVLREDDRSRFVFPFPVLGHRGLPVLLRWPRKIATLPRLASRATEGIYPFAHLFNGALVSIRAVEQIGNVERGFFIFGDEVDYFFRLRKAGTVISVLSAHHYHPDVSARPYSPAKVYYYVKNTMLLNRRYMNLVLLRDALAIAAAIGRTARRNGLGTALSFLVGGQSNALYRAIAGGRNSRLGKDFDA